METFCLPWMNAGQAFDLSATRLNPATYRAAMTAKSYALIEATKGLTDATIKEVKDIILEDARTVASLAQMNALIYNALLAVDAKVKDLGMDAVVAKLSIQEWADLAKAIGKGLKVIREADGPKGQPTPN